MNREDVIRMAREAGFHCYNGCADGIDADLERFFQAAYAAGAAAAVEREREGCAKVAEETLCDTHLPTGVKIYGSRAAAAIRARGETSSRGQA